MEKGMMLGSLKVYKKRTLTVNPPLLGLGRKAASHKFTMAEFPKGDPGLRPRRHNFPPLSNKGSVYRANVALVFLPLWSQ